MKRILFLGALLLVLGLAACKTPSPSGTSYSYWQAYSSAVDSSGNYYVAGTLATSAQASNSTNTQGIPVYWENGEAAPQPLPMGTNGDSTANNFGFAERVVTQGTHVYIVGGVNHTTTSGVANSQAVYWKDGAINVLSLSGGNTWGWADCIAVDGSGNVYVLGEEGNSSTYYAIWKNGTVLASAAANPYFNNQGIAVDSSGNIWVIGLYGTSNNTAAAAYGEYSSSGSLLANGTPSGATNLTGIVADASGHVYMSGTTGGSPFSYSTGYSNNWTPTVWKNLVATSQALTVGATTYTYGFARSLALDSSANIYASGVVFSPGPTVPVYWKLNTTATELNVTGFSSNAAWQQSSIAVDGSGNVDAEIETTPGTATQTNNFFVAPTALINWMGASNAPTTLMSNPVTVQ